MNKVADSVVPLPYSEKELVEAVGEGWRDFLVAAYRGMLLGRLLDERLAVLQREGRAAPSYGPPTGHEATNVGAALALRKEDWVFPGLREQLVALLRGLSLNSYVHHLLGNMLDASRGRLAPSHPTARAEHFVSLSSSVGVQIIQAVGCAYAQRYRNEKGIVVAFFGDGATSTNDFHSGMNFAGVYRLPVLFICVNNQWAQSQPVSKQSAISVLAEKATAYGFPGRRVDGTDVIALHHAVKEARERIIRGDGPFLLESMVYRIFSPTFANLPAPKMPEGWEKEAMAHDPLLRLEGLLQTTKVLSLAEKKELRQKLDGEIGRAFAEAEITPPPGAETLFQDTTKEAFWPLTEERETFDRDQGGHFP